jgi:hypothetical protein
MGADNHSKKPGTVKFFGPKNGSFLNLWTIFEDDAAGYE